MNLYPLSIKLVLMELKRNISTLSNNAIGLYRIFEKEKILRHLISKKILKIKDEKTIFFNGYHPNIFGIDYIAETINTSFTDILEK